ncbi:MAG TPA: hypothetical protein VGU46_07925 [Acidobacteriaceae bacterium]|nr:hypothetical protein [Acidobacteriaceae bacterium]
MTPLSTRFLSSTLLAAVSLAASVGLPASAQTLVPSTAASSTSVTFRVPNANHLNITEQATLLPDAPSMAMLGVATASRNGADPADHAASAATNGLGSPTAQASHSQKYIEPGQVAPPLSANDKVLLGVRDAFSLFSVTAWVSSAGYSHLINSSPNYGTDRGAFGECLGASAIRDITEGVFTDSIMAPIFHQDPRYYRLGPGHRILARALYAATRPLISRTDGGRTMPNLALIAGNAGGSALTNVYYPQINRGVSETLETFGGSMGGSALGDVVSEFYDDVVHPHRHR